MCEPQRKADSAQPWKLSESHWPSCRVRVLFFFYGPLLLPRFVSEAKTPAIKHVLSQMTPGLPETIVQAIKSLFAKTLDSKDVSLAAVTLPKFRLSRGRGEIRKPHNRKPLPYRRACSPDAWCSTSCCHLYCGCPPPPTPTPFDVQLIDSSAPTFTEKIPWLI